MDKAVSLHMATIGTKGGKRRKDHPRKTEFASRAAEYSWSTKARAKRLSNGRAKRKTIAPDTENKD